MPIDARIPLGVQPFVPLSPVEKLMNLARLQQAQQQQELTAAEIADIPQKRELQRLNIDLQRTAIESAAAQRAAAIEELKQKRLDAADLFTTHQLMPAAMQPDDAIAGRLYDSALQTMQQRGIDISKLPPQFDRAYVTSRVRAGIPFKDYPTLGKDQVIPDLLNPGGPPLAQGIKDPGEWQWKEAQFQGQPAIVGYNPKTKETEVLPGFKPIPPRPSQTSIMMGQGGLIDPKLIAQEIAAGNQPPEINTRTQFGMAVQTELARQGFNLSEAVTDWKATQKHIASLNSTQQLRMGQAVDNAAHSLDVIDQLATEWKGGRFAPLNRANLAAAKNGAYGQEAAKIATALSGQISDVTSELANVYMGGNSPTDHALKLAEQGLSADWSEDVLKRMTNLARGNLQIRRNSMRNVGVQGASPDNPYFYGGGGGGPAAPAAPAANPYAAPASGATPAAPAAGNPFRK